MIYNDEYFKILRDQMETKLFTDKERRRVLNKYEKLADKAYKESKKLMEQIDKRKKEKRLKKFKPCVFFKGFETVDD